MPNMYEGNNYGNFGGYGGFGATPTPSAPSPQGPPPGAAAQFDLQTLQEILLSLQEENRRLRKDNFKLAEKIRKVESGNFDEYFIYATNPITLAANGTATTTISITREADFYLTKVVRVSNGAFSFTIRDSSNDRQWSNTSIHSDIGAGTAQLPLILPKPRFIARASTITIDIADLSSMTNTIRLGLIGYKVYHVEDLKTTAG